MTLRPWLSPSAQAQAVREDVWWQTHRTAAPNAFWDELMSMLDMLGGQPDAGVPVLGAKAGMRRVLLSTSRYHVYYLRDDRAGLLRVYAIWGAQRHGRPSLPKGR